MDRNATASEINERAYNIHDALSPYEEYQLYKMLIASPETLDVLFTEVPTRESHEAFIVEQAAFDKKDRIMNSVTNEDNSISAAMRQIHRYQSTHLTQGMRERFKAIKPEADYLFTRVHELCRTIAMAEANTGTHYEREGYLTGLRLAYEVPYYIETPRPPKTLKDLIAALDDRKKGGGPYPDGMGGQYIGH